VRATDWKRVVKPLLPDDAWAFRGRAVHRTPVQHVAIGLLAEGSGWSTGVYLWRLRLPLFVPSEDWTLDWSERLGGGAHTCSTDDEDELHRAISDALGRTGDERDALSAIAEPSQEINWRMLEEVVGSRILLGQGAKAGEAIDEALAEPQGRTWDAGMVERLEELRALVGDGDLDGARHVLDGRAKQTAAALGIARG
jgi:hypothetical protein